MICSNFGDDTKFQLQCYVDNLKAPNFIQKKLGTFVPLKSNKMEEQQHPLKLQELFDKFKSPELLDINNQWFCTKCKVLRNSEKSYELYQTSKYLIISLKRFKQQANGRKVKITNRINFSQTLNLANYLVNLQAPTDSFSQLRQIQPEFNRLKCEYKLIGVINHHGSLEGGHYTASCLNRGEWVNYNDSFVNTILFDKVVTNDAYILFYERE